MKILLILSTFLFTNFLFAQTLLTLEWANRTGNDSTYSDVSKGGAIDDLGNLYSIGQFRGTIDLDPGTDTANFICNGLSDIFIQKLDPNGNFIWAKQIGGNINEINYGTDRIYDIAIDDSQNIYLTGSFTDTVDFDPGLDTTYLITEGNANTFVLKLNSNGDFLWVKQITTSNELGVSELSIAPANNAIYILASTGGVMDIDIDPGPDTMYLTPSTPQSIVIQKLDLDGNFIFGKLITGSGTCISRSSDVDYLGNLYIAGASQDTIDFDPGIGITNLNGNSAGGFILKLDPNGNFIWVNQLEGILNIASISIDAFANVYSTGTFIDTVDFDPGLGTSIYTSTESPTSGSSHDVFVQKLNSDGEFIWAKQLGGFSAEMGEKITTDNLGNVYTAGQFLTLVDFDPGANVYNLNGYAIGKMYIQSLDSNGNFRWAEGFGGAFTERFTSLSVDDEGYIYTTGDFQDTLDFAPGDDEFYLNPISFYHKDIFAQKISQCYESSLFPNTISLPTIVDECMVIPTIPTANNGCEDTFIGTTSTSFPITTQGTTIVSWTYDDGIGNTFSQSQNVSIDDVTNPIPDLSNLIEISGKCKIYYSDLSIPLATDNCSGSITAYTNLSFPIIDQSISHIVWIFDDGNGNVVYQNQNINWGGTVDVSTNLNGNTILANNSNATSYKWIHCINNTTIFGQTNQSFTPTSNGTYAVVITENGCVDTSECVTINTINILELDLSGSIILSPNPTTGNINLDFGLLEDKNIRVINQLGQTIYQKNNITDSNYSFNINAPEGIYTVEVYSDQVRKQFKVIKQ